MEPKLAPGGIFVTQSGPAGVLSCSEVFAPINHTLASVFPRVVPFVAHIPSYVDTWVRCTLWHLDVSMHCCVLNVFVPFKGNYVVHRAHLDGVDVSGH